MVCQHCCPCILYHPCFEKEKTFQDTFVHAYSFVNKSMSMLVDPYEFVRCRIGGFRYVNDRENATTRRSFRRLNPLEYQQERYIDHPTWLAKVQGNSCETGTPSRYIRSLVA